MNGASVLLQMIPRAGRGDVGDQRIRAHGEAANGLRMQLVLPDQIVECEPGESAAFRM